LLLFLLTENIYICRRLPSYCSSEPAVSLQAEMPVLVAKLKKTVERCISQLRLMQLGIYFPSCLKAQAGDSKIS
jgi:hypothetical protein